MFKTQFSTNIRYLIGIPIFILAITLSEVIAQDTNVVLSPQSCSSCDTIIHKEKLLTIMKINCFYDNKEKCIEAVVQEKMKRTKGVGEKWAWYSNSKATVVYYNKLGDQLYKEWWKNGELKRKNGLPAKPKRH